METSTKYLLGFLTLVLLASGVITLTQGNVRTKIDNDKSTFSVNEGGSWKVSGTEYNSLYNGTSKLNRQSSLINITTSIDFSNNVTTVKRITPYIKGPKIIDTYVYDGSISDVESFPVSHTIELINASGLIYQYEVRNLVYNGLTVKDVSSPQTFGRNNLGC
jgi:hypothetical protein